jgi:hypothetical protein
MLGAKDIGADVCLWQKFLAAQALPLLHLCADGSFGGKREQATRAFQAREHLEQTGALDGPTEQRAEVLGFVPQDRDARPLPTDPASRTPGFPQPPGNLASPTVQQQQGGSARSSFGQSTILKTLKESL